MKNLIPFLLLLFTALGCQNTSTNVTPANTNTPPEPKSYALDLIGQTLRIKDEGVSDEHIKQNLANVDKNISYELLKKNADKHAGKPWSCKGKILEISEIDGVTIARLGLDDWGNKAIYITGPIETSFVEKDHVFVVGYLAGNHSYTSQANWEITVPALAIRAMMTPKDAAKYQKAKK